MGTFLSNAVLVAVLLQSPPHDSVRAGLWARVNVDSTDGAAWFELARYYLQLGIDYHAHKKPAPVDTVLAHAILDTAQVGFDRAARFSPGTRTADSARVFRVYSYGERAYVDWEAGGGAAAATLAWHALPEELKLPSVLEELGENLLRACPHQGILFTANEDDTQAAWYLRFGRGLRPDLVVVPYSRWRSDSVLRNRVLRELKSRDPSIKSLGQNRAICASMEFERPPDVRPSVKWNKRPLVWVSGRETKGDRVPAQDFVFAALRQSVDEHETWSPPVLALYRRAAANVGALCKAFDTFGLGAEVGCR
jgi:hypothetical protein